MARTLEQRRELALQAFAAVKSRRQADLQLTDVTAQHNTSVHQATNSCERHRRGTLLLGARAETLCELATCVPARAAAVILESGCAAGMVGHMYLDGMDASVAMSLLQGAALCRGVQHHQSGALKLACNMRM